MITKTFIIPIVVKIETTEGFHQQEAQFIATSIRDKVLKLLNNSVSVVRWSVDKPNETEIKSL